MTFMHKLSCRLALLKDAICIVAALAAASCNIGPRTAPTDGSLARLSISPTLDSLHLNQSTDLTVQGTNQAGDMAPLSLSFSVRGTTGGQITGVTNPSRGRAVGHFKAGQTPGRDSVIAVDTSGIADTAVIIVTPPPVAFVTIAPATAIVSVGNTTAFSATPFDSAGMILANRTITWSSAAPAVATVNAAGLASGVASGSARIIATSESKSDTAVLTVVNVPVASVTVTPLSAAVFVGATTPFSVTLRDAAGQVLTGRVVTWQSTSTAIATVNASGVARGVALGTASIIATSEGQSDTSTVTVSLVPVASVTVTPASATVVVGATTPLSVTLRDSAGGVLTGRIIVWASLNTAVATVTTQGVVRGVAAGSTGVNATSEGRADTSAVTVNVAPPPPPPPPPGAMPDPTLLPVGNRQAPNFTAYEALNVRGAAAGFSYNDPVTGVRVWKVSSPSTPTANTSAGHDYSGGGQEVSRGWGTNGNTHTIHIGAWVGGGYKHWLVDFTRGVGFSNYRPLTVNPARDLMCSFSNVPGQERIMYIHTGTQLVRYNTATMQTENTGFFPLVQGAYAWLQQDKNDVWFAGMAPDNQTAWVWNSQTNEVRTHNESFTNEVYLELDGNYLLFTSGGVYTTTRLWDLAANTFGAVQQSPGVQFHVSHAAALRGRYVGSDFNGLAEMRYDILPTTDILSGLPAYSYEIGDSHHSGMWIQSDADLGGNLLRQWSIANGESGPDYGQYPNMRWKLAIGIIRADGSDSRLLLHHYGMTPNSAYYDYPWGKFSPDGKVVIFNSNMNNQGGRWDLFVAEVPLR